MEHFSDPDHGVTVLLAGIILVFSIHFIWSTHKEKMKTTDESIKNIERKITHLENEVSRFSGILSSYMENTIHLSDKLTLISNKIDTIRR